MKKIFLFTIIVFSGFTFHAHEILTISDFFKNEKGEIKISRTRQKKLKPILGSYYFCALDNCLHEGECSVTKNAELLIKEHQNIGKKFKADYESINILEKRNKDALSRMKISFDTSEFRKDFQSIQVRLEKFRHKVYYKNKISIYCRKNTFDTTDLKKFLLDIEELKKEGQQVKELAEKASKTIVKWLIILEPLEKNRLELEQSEEKRRLSVQEIWLNFVTSQMRLKWNEKQLELKEKQLELKRKEELIEKEKQKFADWRKNTRFSIPYRVEIVTYIIKCSHCSYKSEYKELNFPNLNFAKYGNEDYIKKLWDEHKPIIEKEIIGYRGFFDNPVFGRFGSILNSGCDNCGRPRIREARLTFENKVFKN
jgi:hypothetical protein